MLNPLNFISKFIKSSNQRELDRIEKIVNKINSLEEDTKKLDNSEFPKKLNNLRKKSKMVFLLSKYFQRLLHWSERLLGE